MAIIQTIFLHPQQSFSLFRGALQRHFTQLHHGGAVALHGEAAVGDEVPLPVQGKHQLLGRVQKSWETHRKTIGKVGKP